MDDEHADDAYNGTNHYARPLLNQPVVPNLNEQVAALMEQRSYDIDKVAGGVQNNGACIMQKEGRKRGTRFAVDDLPGNNSRGSASARANQQSRDRAAIQGAPSLDASKPMVDPRRY